MADDPEVILRRVFIDYDKIPEPDKVGTGAGMPEATGEDPGRNLGAFPDLYQTLSARAIAGLAVAWNNIIKGVNT